MPCRCCSEEPESSAPVLFHFSCPAQDHPATAQNLGDATSNRRTNAFGRSDEDACAIAFLSAIIALRDQATALGGSVGRWVGDVKSITKHNDVVSAAEYQCIAGALIANVALTGTIVKMANPQPAMYP